MSRTSLFLALAVTSQAVVIDWRLEMPTSEQSVIVAGDEDITFEWGGYHNVRRVLTREEYNRCDMDDAVMVGDNDESPYTISASAFSEVYGFDTPVYFVCSIGSHCSNAQKVTVTMVANAVVEEEEHHEEEEEAHDDHDGQDHGEEEEEHEEHHEEEEEAHDDHDGHDHGEEEEEEHDDHDGHKLGMMEESDGSARLAPTLLAAAISAALAKTW